MSSSNSTSSNDGNTSGSRRYLFSRHGQSTARTWSARTRESCREQGSDRLQQPRQHDRASRRRRSSRRGRQPYWIDSPDQFEIRKFACPERLHSVFRILEAEGGHGAGEDGLSYSDFSPREVYAALRKVSARLQDGSYCPHPTRLVKILKANGSYRKLRLLRIMDRVVAKALQLALDEYWRTQLPGIARDPWTVWAQMDRAIREHRAYVSAPDDIENCFPNAPLDEVIRCHRQHISQPDLLWLIETFIRGHEGPGHLIGLDQGSPYSSIAMELLLHNHLDTRLEAECQGSPLLRYVDNLTFICDSEYEGNHVLQVADEILASLGFRLKCEERPPMDIRDGDYNRKVLGLIPRWRDGQLMFSIPESTFDDLQIRLLKALEAPRPAQSAWKAAKGSVESLGPALVKRVTPTVVDQVISTARDCGFTELQRKELLEIAHKARKRWLELCERTGGSERG